MNEKKKTTLDFTKICRICLQANENLKSLLLTDAKTYIYELASIKVEINDGFPQNICSPCWIKLYEADEFKKQIKKSNDILQNYVIRKSLGILNEYKNEKVILTAVNTQLVKRSEEKKKEIDIAVAKLKASSTSQIRTACHLCKKNFSCVGQLTRHLKTHTGIRSYVCEVCGKAYMESGSLRKHFLSKHTERNKPYSCPYCKSCFDIRSTLVRHIRIHTGEKPFGCDVCQKSYPSKSYLNEHKKIHLGVREKPFICEICNKSFTLKNSLKAHLITHSHKKPFQCTSCDKAFYKKGALMTHTKYVHTKEKDFMCQICGKTFVTKRELDEHVRRHTGEKKEPKYLCSICNKNLSSSTKLKLHIQSEHTDEKPYVCSLCTKTFITEQDLQIHISQHTDEKPYICNVCSKAFVTNNSLKVHSRVHTSEKQSANLKIHSE